MKESDVIPLFHEKERLQRELDSVQAHANFLQQECESKQRDVQHLQQQSRDRTLQLQLQLDHNHNELAKLGTQCSVLQQTETELQTKLNEMTLAHQQLQTEQAQAVQSAALDRQDHERKSQLLTEQLERYKQRLLNVEEDNEQLRSTARKALQSGDSEVETVRAELVTKYTQLLQEQADEYDTKLEQAKQQQGGQRRLLSQQQPDAAPIQDDGEDSEPLGMLQLLEQRDTALAQLSNERARRKKAMLAVSRFQKEMAIAAPQWRQQKEELELALDRLEELESRLKAALEERKYARAEEREARQEVAEMEKKLEFQRGEAKCLAKQVQDMLVSRSDSGGDSGARDIDSPVTIAEIQTQNMQLLSDNRKLSQTIADLESTLQSDKLEQELQEAREEASTLTEQRKEQEAMVQKIVQQRDLYRALLNTQDNQALAGDDASGVTALTVAQTQAERAKTLEQRVVALDAQVSKCESEVHSATRDKENAEERLRRYEVAYGEVTSSNSDLQRELLSAKGEAAKAQSESSHYQERCTRLEDSNERFRNQAAEEKASCLEFQKLNTSLQNSLSTASADRNEVESTKRQMEAQLRLMQAQLSEAQATATRKAEENALLQSDNARQGSMIDSIRRIESNLSAKDTAEKERLQKELESVSEKLETIRTKHTKDTETLTLEVNDWKGKASDLERTSHNHQTTALKAKKDLLESKQELKALQSKCTKLESQLKSAKRKLGEEDDTEDVETQLQTKIDELEIELAEAKRGMAALESQVDEYKSVAQAGEQELVTVQKSTEGFKAELQRELEDLQSQLANTDKEKETRQVLIRDLTNDLAGQRGEKDKLEQELRTRIAELEAQISSNADIVDTAKTTTESMKQDIQKYSEEAGEAQKNYERELALHAEARGKLREVHESLDKERREKTEQEEKLEAVQSQLQECEAKFNTEKETLVNDISELKANLANRREENKTLHDQIQSINAKLVAEQTSNLTEPTGDSDHDAEMKRVQDVLTFLRSENETIQQQLDAATRATDREKSTVESLRRSLDSARAELKIVQDSTPAGEESASTVSTLRKHLGESENQVNLLRDSNKLLREESAKLASKLNEMSTQLEVAQKSAAPADDIKRELGDQIKSLEAEKASLLRENESWKSRMKSMVNNLQQVDPEEHKKVLKQVEQLKAEKASLDALKTTTEAESKRLRSFLQKLKDKKNELEATVSKQQKEIDTSKTNSSTTKSELVKMKEKLAAMDKEKAQNEEVLGGVHKQADKLREAMRSLKTQVNDLKKREKELMGAIEAEKKKRVARPETAKPSAVPEPRSAPTPAPAAATTPVPKVPVGGFKFGPSSGPTAKEPVSSSNSKSAASSGTTKPPVVVVESGAKRPSSSPSGEAALINMREQLALKIKRRRLDLSKAKGGEKQNTASDNPPPGKAEKADAGSRSVSPKPKSNDGDETPATVGKPAETKKEEETKTKDVTAEQTHASEKDGSTPPDGGGGENNETQANDGAIGGTSDLPTIQEVPKPASPVPEKAFDGTQPQSGKPASLDKKEPSAFGSAFLNIQAPGTGNKTPTFSFGSSNITLTAPSLPTPTTPFTAFGSSTSFGSPAPGGQTGNFPSLFGTVAAPPDEASCDKNDDGKPDVMESEE